MGHETLTRLLRHPQEVEVTVLARDRRHNHRQLDKLEQSGAVRVIWGDLRDYDTVARGVADADYVLHVGGMVSPAADHCPKTTMQVNVGAARNIARATLARPDKGRGCRVIYIGSVAQLGNRYPHRHWGRSGDPVWHSLFDTYGLSKIRAEREIAEAGLPHWVSLRQTGILAFDIVKKGSDPITFHVPLQGVLEWVTAEDSGQLLTNLVLADLPESFWNRFYNIGGGAGFRLTNYEFEQLILKAMYCPEPEKVFHSNWFATRNFHGMWYEDSDLLEDLLHFRTCPDAETYFKEFQRKLPWYFRLTPIVPAAVIRKAMSYICHHAPLGTMSWVRDGNKKRLDAYFGGLEEWKKIPDWNDTDLSHPSETPCRIDHGYDENIPESQLGLEECRSAAHFRGGRCLSAQITPGDLDTPQEWECHAGHRFTATPRLILLGGHWCPECFGDNPDYEDIARHNPFFAQVYRKPEEDAE